MIKLQHQILALFCGILVGCIITYRVIKGDDLLSFLGSILGVLGAYAIFNLGKKEEQKLKHIEEERNLEYKKLVLYNLLDYTIMQTRKIYIELDRFYKENYANLYIEGKKISEDEDSNGHLSNDIVILVLNNIDIDIAKFLERLDRYFNEVVLDNINLKKLIYDLNWSNYLDCVGDVKDIQRIITWINLIAHSDKNLDVVEFIMWRDCTSKIIDRYYPQIKDAGFRGIISKASGY